MIPGSCIEKAASIQKLLVGNGFHVSRHACDMMVYYGDKLVGCIYIYKDECIFSAYNPWREENSEHIAFIKYLINKTCLRTRTKY